jgi:hypothetical protein
MALTGRERRQMADRLNPPPKADIRPPMDLRVKMLTIG